MSEPRVRGRVWSPRIALALYCGLNAVFGALLTLVLVWVLPAGGYGAGIQRWIDLAFLGFLLMGPVYLFGSVSTLRSRGRRPFRVLVAANLIFLLGVGVAAGLAPAWFFERAGRPAVLLGQAALLLLAIPARRGIVESAPRTPRMIDPYPALLAFCVSNVVAAVVFILPMILFQGIRWSMAVSYPLGRLHVVIFGLQFVVFTLGAVVLWSTRSWYLYWLVVLTDLVSIVWFGPGVRALSRIIPRPNLILLLLFTAVVIYTGYQAHPAVGNRTAA